MGETMPRHRLSVCHIGLATHQRDKAGRLFFPRCESTRTDCQARPSYLITLETGAASGKRFHRSQLCHHHAEEAMGRKLTREERRRD